MNQTPNFQGQKILQLTISTQAFQKWSNTQKTTKWKPKKAYQNLSRKQSINPISHSRNRISTLTRQRNISNNLKLQKPSLTHQTKQPQH